MATCQSETVNNSTQEVDDPCIAVCRDFIAKHVAMDASPEPDIPEPISDAAYKAWERVKGQRPITVAGFAAVLRSYVMWLGEEFSDDQDVRGLFEIIRGLCDLVGFDAGQALVEPQSVPIAELQAVAEDYHTSRYRDYLAALQTWATMPSGALEEAYQGASSAVDDIADDLMTGPAATVHAVMLKARTAHHQMMASAQANSISPTVPAEYFGIIAADLEILTAGGKAVWS